MYGQNIPSDRVVYKLNRGDVGNQVIEHFDGSKWSLFPGPKFQSTDQPALESLTAVSPQRHVGRRLHFDQQQAITVSTFRTLRWHVLEGLRNARSGWRCVSADATNDFWAVGQLEDCS